MPRGDLKAYTSITARIPQDLANEAKRYAGIHRLSVSELVRDGLEMRLEEGDVPGRTTGKPGEPGEEVLHEVLPHSIKGHTEVLPRKSAAHTPAQEGLTEVLPHHADFDPTKFYLGKLCPRGHDYRGTGKSLLRKHNNGCPLCLNAMKREKRARQKAARQEG
jgi:hypothetical protein